MPVTSNTAIKDLFTIASVNMPKQDEADGISKWNLSEAEKLLLNKVGEKPDEFDSEILRMKIRALLPAAEAEGLPEGITEEDRQGLKRYFCTHSENAFTDNIFNSNIFNGGTKIFCYCAPLIVYAIMFGWTEELKAMLEAGFVLDESMRAYVMQISPIIYGYPTPELGIIGLLFGREMPDDIFIRCIDRISERSVRENAVISMNSIFYRREIISRMGGFEDLRTTIPFADIAKPGMLQRKLRLSYEKAPGLFLGGMPEISDTSGIRPEPLVLLEAMVSFLQIYKKNKMAGTDILFDYGREYLKEFWTEGGIFEKTDFKQIVQYVEKLESICKNTKDDENLNGFLRCLLLAIYSCYNNFFVKTSEKSKSIDLIAKKCHCRCSDEQVYRFFVDICYEMVNGEKQKRFAFTSSGFEDVLDAYAKIVGKKPVIKLNAKECTIIKEFFNHFVYSPDGAIDEDDYVDVCSLQQIVDKIDRFEYVNRTPDIMLILSPVLQYVINSNNKELMRSCIVKDFIDEEYAQSTVKKLLDSGNVQMVPLLLLKKYGYV